MKIIIITINIIIIPNIIAVITMKMELLIIMILP